MFSVYSPNNSMEEARVIPKRARKPLKSASDAHECRICQRSFTKQYNLLIHERTHLKGLEHGPVACDICGKMFRKVETMKNHRVSHSPPSVPKELKGFLVECVTY